VGKLSRGYKTNTYPIKSTMHQQTYKPLCCSFKKLPKLTRTINGEKLVLSRYFVQKLVHG
jgi:hypothetical protein